MKTIVKVKKIEADEKAGISIIYGQGDVRKGFSITFEVVKGYGMIYAGHNEGVDIEGRDYTFWFVAKSPGQALYALQQGVTTENYEDVIKTSEWKATTNYGRGNTEVFDNEQDALEFALNCRECMVGKFDYSEPTIIATATTNCR